MRILVMESDREACKHLEKLLKQIAPGAEIAGCCTSVKEARQWFAANPMPDLALSVVQLPGGLSFDVFRKLDNKVPVIFTCFFDRFAIDAFKVNGIDYLIKPVKEEDLRAALCRYETRYSRKQTFIEKEGQPAPVLPHYQERFIVTIGKQLKLIQAEEIAYFYTENKIVYLVTGAGEKHTLDLTLEQLEKILNPRFFFRINRQFVINISSIVKMIPASKSRLKLIVKPETRHELITSFERTATFRKWLMGVD